VSRFVLQHQPARQNTFVKYKPPSRTAMYGWVKIPDLKPLNGDFLKKLAKGVNFSIFS